jgi:hypothetical protein
MPRDPPFGECLLTKYGKELRRRGPIRLVRKSSKDGFAVNVMDQQSMTSRIYGV